MFLERERDRRRGNEKNDEVNEVKMKITAFKLGEFLRALARKPVVRHLFFGRDYNGCIGLSGVEHTDTQHISISQVNFNMLMMKY